MARIKHKPIPTGFSGHCHTAADARVGKISGILFLFLISPGLAAIHPVPLDKDTKATQCVACHEAKTKGKAVHSAIATGCFSCHELRVTKDATRVKLTTATAVKLCIQCHADKDMAKIKGQVHSPNGRDCLKCHDPHTAEFKNVLVKSESGATKADNLCLQCHATGLNVAAKGGSRHAALDMGCDTCHVIHKNGASPDREFRYHLTKAAPALCLDCHDPKDKKIADAHQNQPIEKSDCITCHDPHESKSPKLMQTFLHSPFADKTCDACHAPAKDGKIVLAQSKKEMCGTCHADVVKRIATAKVKHEGAQGDCTDCHSPHAGKTQGFLRPDPVTACLSCHPDQEAQIKKSHPHQPASEEGCFTCHESHGGDNAKLLRAKTVNQGCLECHGPDRTPTKLEKENLVTIFDGKVKLPAEYFRKVSVLPIKAGLGHPTEHHPVQDLVDPNTGAVTTALNCLSCHTAHGSAKAGLLIKDQSDNMDFCKSCHVNGLNLKFTRGSK
jgi:predicted CXXCH cytochrome family protein